MPKLNKRPPESRSQKRERIGSEQEQERRNEERVRIQKAQDWKEYELLLKWLSLMKHRFDSEEAYAQFESYYRQNAGRLGSWNTPDPELLLTIFRHKDGKAIDPEIILNALEQEPRLSMLLLSIAKQLAIKELWSGSQLGRLQDILIKHLSFHRWHKSVRPIARLARVITDDAFEARVRLLLAYGGAREEMATRLLAQLEQERKMRVGRPRKR